MKETFNFSEAKIFRAVMAERIMPVRLVRLVSFSAALAVYIGYIAWIVSVAVAGFGLMPWEASKKILGFSLFLTALGMPIWAWYWFVISCLRQPPLKNSLASVAKGEAPGANIAELLDAEAAEAVETVLHSGERAGAHELFAAIRAHPFIQRIFKRMGMADNEIKALQGRVLSQPSVEEVVKQALMRAYELGGQHIGMPSIFLALADKYEPLRNALFNKEIRQEELEMVVHWERYNDVVAALRRKFWLPENLARVRGIGLEWARSGTWRLERYAQDMRDVLEGREFLSHAIGRDSEIGAMEEALTKGSENNVLIIGRPGVGRHAVAYRFANRVISGQGIASLSHFRVFNLDLGAIISRGAHRGDLLNEIRKVFEEAALAKNVILIIDNFDSYLGGSSLSPLPDLTGILLQFLPLEHFRLIAISSLDAFHRIIESQKDLLANFSVIELDEPEEDVRLAIMLDALPHIEKRSKVLVTFPALRAVLRFGDQYFPNEPFPEKGIDLLGETVAHALAAGKAFADEKDVREVIAAKVKAPVGEAGEEERKKLLNLEAFLHRRIVNQDEAIKAIAGALRRVRAEIHTTKRPVGSFLFLGPTGVGKTETAKALAEVYYGSEERMIRFDMSEYQHQESVVRLIGSSDGREAGRLSSQVRDHPFSLVLLDEIEKAHPKILDVLLQVLDEGKYTDARGDVVSFVNAIIIATSNAGSEFIRQLIQSKKESGNMANEVVEYVLRANIFKPEFLNRFDAVITYPPLSKANLIEIAKLLLGRLAKRLDETQGITMEISEELAVKVAELGYNPQFGARPMRRVIQNKVENLIAQRLLRNDIKRGDVISIQPQDIA